MAEAALARLGLRPAERTGAGLPAFLPHEVETGRQQRVQLYGPADWGTAVRARPGRLRARGVLHSRSVL